jgi:hypothetical protein
MKTKNRQNNQGYALLVVLFAVTAIASFLAMLTFSASQQAFTVRRLSDNLKAKAIAESGCEYAYSVLSTDWEARNAAGSLSPASDSSEAAITFNNQLASIGADAGNYFITINPIGSSAALVTTVGSFGAAKADAIIGVQDFGGSSDDGTVLDAEAFSYAILCGGSLDFSGCGTIMSPAGRALFHANGGISLRGTADALIDLSSSTQIKISNNVTVGGSIKAPILDYKAAKVTIGGSATQTAVPSIGIPDIDLTPYHNWAARNGEIKNGSFAITTDYTPAGGILWVDGDFHASSHATVNGSVIATGSIFMSGNTSVNPTLCAFGLVARDGDINITSSGTLTGLIYAKTGHLSHTANGQIAGQIIVNGDIKKAGNSAIMTAYTPSIPSPPDRSASTIFIGISAWQK